MSTRNRITLPDNASAHGAVLNETEFDNKSGTLCARVLTIPKGAPVWYSEPDSAIIIETGSTITVDCIRTGSLPADHRLQLLHDCRNGTGSEDHTVYVVWSYDTPIMWVPSNGAKYVPSVRYSLTTTRHQAAITGGYFSGSESARAGKGQSPYGPRNGGF